MTDYTLPRREFLVRALAACGAPFCVPAAQLKLSGSSAQPKLSPTSDVATRYFGEAGAEGARAIGEAYARQLNIEATKESIVTAAQDVLQLIARASGPDAATTELVNAVRRDFREGRTVQVDGWVLSRTEVELCLLTLVQ
jgi:hypothetical protein